MRKARNDESGRGSAISPHRAAVVYATLAALMAALPPAWGAGGGKSTDAEVRATASAGPTRPHPLGAYPGHENHPTKRWAVTLDCKPISYALQHWACYHKSHAPQAIALEGQIGMTAPNAANWYFNGFLDFFLDNVAGRNYAIKAVRALDNGPRASCEFVWELPPAWVRVRFMVVPGWAPLFCSVRQYPKGKEVPRLRVRLSCYPSGYFRDGARVAVTPKRTVQAGAKADLDPAAEWWVILYDKVYDLGVSGGVGGCGAALVPEGVATSRLTITSYGCFWEISAQQGERELRIALWDGLNKPNAELVAALKPQFAPAMDFLRRIDFTPLRLRPEAVHELKAQFWKYAAETPECDKEKKAFEQAMKRLEQLRARLGGGVDDVEAEQEMLKAIEAAEKLLWQVKMKWVFAD